MTICESIGEWAAALALRDVPERVRERARLQTASIVAAGRAGESAAERIAAAAPEGRLGEVYAGAAASMAHDWDDYLFMGHPGHSSVWVARAFADDPDRALLAQIAGNEVAGRIGAALLLGPHNGQFWSSIHCASAALAAGVALRLDEPGLANALAIALYQPPFGLWPGFMGPETKLLTAAEPAVQGARAALLAAEGMGGPLDVVEHPRGLLRNFAFVGRPRMLGALGRVWLTDTLAFKPHPGCAYLQTAIAGALTAGVAADEVGSIEVDAGYLTVEMEALGAAAGLTPVGVGFSVARSVAIALLAGRLTHHELDPAWLAEHADQITNLAGRIRVRHDWDCTLQTVRGMVEAGATLGDVPLTAVPRLLQGLSRAGTAGDALRPRELRELLGRAELRGQLPGLLRRRSPAGIEALDTDALRMSFPARLRIERRSGPALVIDGPDRGSAGHALEEQRGVVEDRCALVGLDPADLQTAGAAAGT